MFRTVLIAILLVAICSVGLAQRPVTEVTPTLTDPTLIFDVNEFPIVRDRAFESDFNFAPKVVFAPDSKRGFVTFPSTNKVAVFDTADGSILQMIEVARNPTALAITPDGRTLAVACVFLIENLPTKDNFDGARIGAISIIDVETLGVRNIELTKVLFSMANNIVFSGDSSTGFIASSGTDEILRFDVANAQEMSPRLKMDAGTRPTAITMAHDFSFFGVVLVGSSALPRQIEPDSVQIVDTESFSVTKSLSFQVDLNLELPYDFRAENRIAFSHDGTLALIGEQANSRFGQGGVIAPSLLPDRALLIDVENNELISAFLLGSGLTGGVAGAAHTTPDGRFFVLPTALDLIVVNIETARGEEANVLNISPSQAEFRPTTRPGFTSDGRMYIGTPITDFLLTFKPATGEVPRAKRIGGVVERPFQGGTLEVPSAPMDITVSPDGRVISVLDFNANKIELLRTTFPFYSPELNSSSEFSTGVAFVNASAESADLEFRAFNGSSGDPFEDDETTEDTVEFQQPAPITLAPNAQVKFTTFEALQPDPVVDINGWLDIETDQSGLVGMFQTFDSTVSRMDGGRMNTDTLQFAIFPDVRVTDGFNTELVLMNPNFSGSANATMTLFDLEGNQLFQNSQTIFTERRNRFFVADSNPDNTLDDGLFPQVVLQDFQGGYIVLVTTSGVIAYQRHFDQNRMAVLQAVGLTGNSDFIATRRFSVPHVVVFEGADTILNLLNLGVDTTTITLTLHDDQGGVIAGPVEETLEVQKGLRRSIIDLLGLQDNGMTVTGWLEIETEISGLIGNAEIQGVFGQTMSAFPMQASRFRRLVFPHVASVPGLETGLVLLNTGPDPQEVEVELRRGDASLIQSINLNLQSGERVIGALPTLFPDLAEVLGGGTVIVKANAPVAGLEMFFSNRVLSVVPSQGFEED